MKVLYSLIYPPDLGGSGAPIYTSHLLKALSNRGERPGVLFSTHQSYQNSNTTYYQSLPLYFDRPPIFDNHPQVPNSQPFKTMTFNQIEEYVKLFYQALEQAVQTQGYELIHVQHGMYIGYAASLIKKKLGVPYVITLHNMELIFLPEFPDPILAMAAMVNADRILAFTEVQKQKFLQLYTKENIIFLETKRSGKSLQWARNKYQKLIGSEEKINPSKVILCPPGIDTKLFRPLPAPRIPADLKRLKIPHTSPVVLFVGRLIKMKGIRHLLEAEPLYNQKEDTYTLIIGGGKLEAMVKKTCQQRKNVHFLGFKQQTELPYYYNFAATHNGLLCVPSRSEVIGLVYLEAMACGLRVVAASRADTSQLDFMQPPFVQYAAYGDPQELARKISLMLEEKNFSRTEIRRRVTKYNSQTLADCVYSIYKDILR